MSKAENIITSVKVEIGAPASLVWSILVDLEKYREWNPFTVRVESTLDVGAPVELFLPDPANPGKEIHVTEYLAAFEPHRLLSWEQRPTGESKDAARRDQYIEELGPTSSSYFTTDIFLGPNADEISRNFGPWVKQGFDAMALSLKDRAETIYRNGVAKGAGASKAA